MRSLEFASTYSRGLELVQSCPGSLENADDNEHGSKQICDETGIIPSLPLLGDKPPKVNEKDDPQRSMGNFDTSSKIFFLISAQVKSHYSLSPQFELKHQLVPMAAYREDLSKRGSEKY